METSGMGEVRLDDWVGRSQELADHLHPLPVRAFAATLNTVLEPTSGDLLPELWHWFYFLPLVPMAEVGPDGHPKRGGFLPPVPLDRRMWAGGRLVFHGDLRVGEAISQRSEILKVAEKEGKAGRMVFVTVRHEVSSERGLAIEEEQDIVYVAMPEKWVSPPPVPAPAEVGWSEEVAVNTVLLFRFSALTFNGHRIHYDLPYATGVEKYPGLVVHGPLQAMLLMDAAKRRHPGRRPASFTFRGVRPLFHFESARLVGRADPAGGHDLFTVNGDGAVTMQATVHWRGE
jgi:3-methylfumaryl-CoA hydratase